MINEKKLSIVCKDGVRIPISIRYPSTHPWFLEVESQLVTNRYESEDLIGALTELRLDLEAFEAKLLCVGCMKNSFSSGMSRNMSGGRKVYMLKKGEPASLDSLRDIFDPADLGEVVKVAEQHAFINDWYESL